MTAEQTEPVTQKKQKPRNSSMFRSFSSPPKPKENTEGTGKDQEATQKLENAETRATQAEAKATQAEARATQAEADLEKAAKDQKSKTDAAAHLKNLRNDLHGSLQSHLGSFEASLKEALRDPKHHGAIDKIRDQIQNEFGPLVEEGSKKGLERFKTWFDGMVDSHKDTFPENNWLWHDVIKPIFTKLLGAIVTLVGLAIRPLGTGLSEYGRGLFKSPETSGQKSLREKAKLLHDEIEKGITEKATEMDDHKRTINPPSVSL